jgi:hypothetical protein
VSASHESPDERLALTAFFPLYSLSKAHTEILFDFEKLSVYQKAKAYTLLSTISIY